MEIKDNLRKLIAENKIKKVIDLLKDLFKNSNELNSVILLSARFSELERNNMLGLLDNQSSRIEYAKINHALLQIIDKIEDKQAENKIYKNEMYIHGNDIISNENISNSNITINVNKSENKTSENKKSADTKDEPGVFISYNHKDREIVDKLGEKLKSAGLKVIIDNDAMKAGENITRFIEESIKKSAVTLSIISNNSLLSSWVGIETINTFYAEKVSNKKFIACYTDEDFFENEFRITATEKIDEKIKKIDGLIIKCMNLKLDPTDLNYEKTRLFQLRNNLGDILARLRGSLCIDIKEYVFEKSIKRLIEAIKE